MFFLLDFASLGMTHNDRTIEHHPRLILHEKMHLRNLWHPAHLAILGTWGVLKMHNRIRVSNSCQSVTSFKTLRNYLEDSSSAGCFDSLQKQNSHKSDWILIFLVLWHKISLDDSFCSPRNPARIKIAVCVCVCSSQLFPMLWRLNFDSNHYLTRSSPYKN